MIHLWYTLDVSILNLRTMPTQKKRLNLCLPDEMESILVRLAKRDDLPQATKAVQLIQIAIEIEEDDIWNQLAEQRDTRATKFVSHKKAWK